MLEQERKFDEAALGFSKFSRFLRQAHDEGIIDLERGPEGNYLISPIGGAAGAPAQTSGKGTPAKATDAVGDSEAKSGGTRRGRSERSDRGARPDRDRDRGKKPDSRPEKTVEVVAEKLESTTPVPPEPTSGATPEPTRPIGMGRFRRGSRGRPAPSASRTTAPGPVEAEAPKVEAETAPAVPVPSSDEASPVKAPSAAPGDQPRRSVSGRQRGRGGSSQARPAARRDSPPATTPEDSQSAGTSEPSQFREQIEAMSRNYPGVGRRTADVLFREFGDRTYQVIDEQPERIRAVLPEHRAKAVLAGREAERTAESRDG
jgi:hypothetical protein